MNVDELLSGLTEQAEVTKTKPKRASRKPTKAEPDTPIYRTFEDFDFTDLQHYAGLDTIVTSELLAKLWPDIIMDIPYVVPGKNGARMDIRAPALISSSVKDEMFAHEYIIDMEMNGIVYDVDMNRRMTTQMSEEIAQLEASIFDATKREFDLNSGPVIAELLYGEMGFEPPVRTKSGDPSTDGDSLLTLAGLNPKANIYVAPDPKLQFLCDIVKRTDLSSVCNTFLTPYVDKWVKKDGRVHPSYNMVGTSGFRISGDSPNLLNLPRPKHGYNVRACYTVEDNEVFIAADFSSAEVKVLANLSKDPAMMKAVDQGLDFHSVAGSALSGIPFEDFVEAVNNKAHPMHKQCKHHRQVAKILTFSLLYGSSEGGIAFQLNIPVEEARSIMASYFRSYPGIEKFVNESHQISLWNQMVVTPFGQRKKEFGAQPIFRPTAAYNASLRNSTNVRVQSPTSTLGLITFAHLNNEIKQYGGKSICTVYDSTEVSAPIENAAKVVETVFHYMDDFPVQHFDWLDLPIGCEVEVGTRWSNLETVHRGISQEEIESLVKRIKEEERA